MKPPDSTPDPFDRFDRVLPRDPEKQLARLEEWIEDFRSGGEASREAVNQLLAMRDAVRLALDPAYQPPPHLEFHTYGPLLTRAWNSARREHFSESMELVCRFWGYCTVGTPEFSAAASRAVDNAASLGDWHTARSLAGLFLAHFPVAMNPGAERLFRGPSAEGSPGRTQGNIRRAMPLEGALRGMREDRAQVWVDVLELAVREWPLRQAPAFRAAVAALRDHYTELGDAENLRRVTVVLTAEEPWREGHRGPPVTE